MSSDGSSGLQGAGKSRSGQGGSARRLFLTLSVVLPWPIRAFLYRRLFGWQIDPTSRIGLSIVDARSVRLARMSRIGHFSVIRNLSSLELGEEAIIGNWNWISSAALFTDADRALGTRPFRGLLLGRHSAITSRHYLDCSGGISIGDLSVVGGIRTTILTHSIDFQAGVQSTDAVAIGDRCFVSSNVSMVPGSRVPPGCLIAMGAVVVGQLKTAEAVYAGVPAKLVKSNIEGAYFRRQRGFTGLGTADPGPEQPN
jgi:acetyltransferase-like isoleucine patch superfamily enzyme